MGRKERRKKDSQDQITVKLKKLVKEVILTDALLKIRVQDSKNCNVLKGAFQLSTSTNIYLHTCTRILTLIYFNINKKL